jgi:hypothetical protein
MLAFNYINKNGRLSADDCFILYYFFYLFYNVLNTRPLIGSILRLRILLPLLKSTMNNNIAQKLVKFCIKK